VVFTVAPGATAILPSGRPRRLFGHMAPYSPIAPGAVPGADGTPGEAAQFPRVGEATKKPPHFSSLRPPIMSWF